KGFKQVLALESKTTGAENPLSICFLAKVYEGQNRYAEAEAGYKRALAMWETTKESFFVPIYLDELGHLSLTQRRYADAEAGCKRSMEFRIEKKDNGVGRSYGNLALLYDAQGKYADALPLFQKRLDHFEPLWGKDDPELAPFLEEHAKCLRKAKRPAEAA